MTDQDVPAVPGEAPTYAMDEIAARAAAARQRSAAIAAAGNRTAARPEWDFNHVIAYGQSLSSGWEGWPALTTAPVHDCLMVGGSVNGISENGGEWLPAGEARFSPLVATVMSNAARGEVLTAEAVAALPPGTPALGETVLEGALHFWRGRQLAAGTADGRLVASSCGVGGRSVEQLSSAGRLFNRPRMAVAAARDLAVASGGSYGIVALLLLHGENNSVGRDGTQDRQEFLRLTEALQADFNREIVGEQTRMPAVFTHQVSGIYVRDSTGMAIPMAQLDCAYALPDWFMVGPSYPVTEKGGHLDANGYRWLGQQFGKVMHRVLDRGEGWKPLHPLHATWRGRQVLIDFHVPHPPLVFAPCYVRTRATSFADGGFSVSDDDGRIAVSAAAVVAETSVLLVLERAPGANPVLWYADEAGHGGYGNLRDSDPTLASQSYEFRAGSGQYPGAEILALIGRRYPLWNWCVAFRATIAADPPIELPLAPAEPEPVSEPAPEPMPEPVEAPVAAATPAAETAAWQALRAPAEPVMEPAPEPPRRGFLAWLRRLFGG